jgi:hypothetical protein
VRWHIDQQALLAYIGAVDKELLLRNECLVPERGIFRSQSMGSCA